MYDWMPVFGMLGASALILNGLFPGSLTLAGRSLSVERSLETEEDGFDLAISQMENGVLMLSAIRDGGPCAARLACRLGSSADGESPSLLVDTVRLLLPGLGHRLTNFTQTLEDVAKRRDTTACQQQCNSCINV